jgi:class II lanthipeptide synthase
MVRISQPDRCQHMALSREERRPDARVRQQRFLAGYTRSANGEQRGLLNAVLPLAEASRESVRRTIASLRLADPQQSLPLGDALEATLFRRLFAAASKTLVLELAVARKRGLLKAETPEARYAFFCDCLNDRGFAAALLAQYPLLLPRLVKVVALWEASTCEMLGRLDADFTAIRAELIRHDPGWLVGAEPAGDPHAGGRCVHRLRFADGSRLIYKPRPVAMEHGVYAFARWLNDKGHSPALGGLNTIDRGSYGWTEYAEAAPCPGQKGVERFFLRQGANIAIAYLLGGSDLHYENIIAAGEYPIIVDLETLFHDPTATGDLTGASAAAFRILGDSVTRTLLLPARVESSGTDDAADISALGYSGGQQAPYVALDWADWETDTMHMAEKRGVLPAARCLPVLDGEAVAASDHVELILSGFSNTYDLMLRHRQKLFSGPLGCFKGRTIRRVFRPTSTYVQLLANSWHPAYSVDASALRAMFHRSLGGVDESAAVRAAIEKSEIRDLLNGDIPYFRARVGGRSQRRKSARPVLPSNGWQACRKRVTGLSLHDKQRQLWITQLSFVDLNAELPKSSWRPRRIDETSIEKAAIAIGDRLCETAITESGRVSWLFPVIDDKIHLAPAVVGFDLYDGLAGIALFLGRLAVRTGRGRYRRMTEAAIREALAIFRRLGDGGATPGGFEGSGGLAYALALLGDWLDRPDWRRKSVALIISQSERAAQSRQIDLISGRAGFLASGVAVSKITGERSLLENLRPCAENLMTLPSDLAPLPKDAGLAHGRAGIGLARLRWVEVSGVSGRKDALAYLTGDMKIRTNVRSKRDGRAMIAWCRGAVGTALAASRLHLLERTAAATIVGAITQRVAGIRGDYALCLCHGLFGLMEFLDEAARTDVPGAKAALHAIRREALSRVMKGEFCSDHAHRLEAPGLMKGLAGTGYALLRLLEHDRVPSVLTLESA